ncbi:MAG: DUF1475 family protein [Pirellulaceae bacterium]
MLRWLLILVFSIILLTMLVVTTYASLDRSILEVGSELTTDPWFHATLADAYFGFLTFYCWVAYKERSWGAKGIWLALVLILGNIAMASYVLWQLIRLGSNFSPAAFLLRPSDLPAGPDSRS